MPSDVEKAYIKKHKINDMLNELFIELTTQKPENPVEFALKHFEAKLPKENRPTSSMLVSRILPLDQQISITDMTRKPAPSQGDADIPPVANNLFSKLFSRPLNFRDDGDQGDIGRGGGNFALSTFNIINKLDRINAKLRNEMSTEEILEKENINFTKTRNEEEEDTKPPRMVITYKTDLKNRESVLKHKNEIRNLVVQEMRKRNDQGALGHTYDRSEADDEETRSYQSKKDPLQNVRDEEETEQLDYEILTARNYNRISTKEAPKKRKFQRLNSLIPGAGIGLAALNTSTPQVKLVICQVCSKIQSNLIEEKNDFANKEFLSGVNENQVQTAPILSSKEPLIKEESKPVGASNLLDSNPFFEFFKTSVDQKKLGETRPGNLDDDPIESASQVSGPRHIEPFELPTNRSSGGGEHPSINRRESGVLAWVMARQTNPIGTEEKTTEASDTKVMSSSTPRGDRPSEKVSSRPGSHVSKSGGSTLVGSSAGLKETARGSHVSTERKKEGSGVGHQAWRVKESDSDISSTTRKQASGQKKN